jgi:hypothetical protein
VQPWQALLSDECLGSPSDLDVDGLLAVHGSTVLYYSNANAAQLTAAATASAGSVPVHHLRRDAAHIIQAVEGPTGDPG